MKKDSLVLVTGATGYIGGRLVPRLLEAGWNVRCLVRDPKKLAQRAWIADARVEVVEGDLSKPGIGVAPRIDVTSSTAADRSP